MRIDNSQQTSRIRHVSLAFVVVVALLGGAWAYTTDDGFSNEVPQTTFESIYHASNDTLVLHHVGDDALTGENTGSLDVYVAPTDGKNRTERRCVGTLALPVEAGDSRRVTDVEPGQTVSIVWRAGDGGSAVLYRKPVVEGA